MKDALKKVVVAAGLAFTSAAAVTFTPTDAEACKVTVYARKDAPLRDVPKQHSTGFYWQKFGGNLKNHPKIGRYEAGNTFRSIAQACNKYAVERKKVTGAAYATWEMPVCKLDRVNEMSPEARKRWKAEVADVCFKKHTIR